MSGLKRLSPEVRKAEIMEAGARIFYKEGIFQHYDGRCDL